MLFRTLQDTRVKINVNLIFYKAIYYLLEINGLAGLSLPGTSDCNSNIIVTVFVLSPVPIVPLRHILFTLLRFSPSSPCILFFSVLYFLLL